MFPLPVAPSDRTDALQFIPDIPDLTGSGERFWRIMSKMPMTQGAVAGKRFGEVALPWQEKLIKTAYAEHEDGTPIFDNVLLLVAKKQGKSEMIGKLLPAQAIHQPTPRGHMVCIAATDKQAGLVYDSMASACEADPVLSSRFNVRRYKADIQDTKTHALLRTAAPEAKSLVGIQCFAFCVDELHVLGGMPKAGSLVRQLESGTKIFNRGKGWYISTAPIGISAGIYQSMYARAKRILSGEEPHGGLLPVIFEMPEETWDDLDSHVDKFWMANPSMGSTLTEEWLLSEYHQAKADPDSSRLRDFLSQHLNIPAAETMGIDRWIPPALWDSLTDRTINLEWILQNTDWIYCGIDAGLKDDATALVVMGVRDDKHFVWSRQWLHRDAYDLRRTQAEYDEYIEDGELRIVDHVGEDLADLFELVVKIQKSGKLASVGVDQHKLTGLITDLESQGVDCVSIPQGWQLTRFIIHTDRLIHEGKLNHWGGKMLRFNMQNAQLSERGRGLALVKPNEIQRGVLKIDGAVCLVMAIATTQEAPPSQAGMFTL
jgi:phage terminase large subunit-like protein